MPKISRFFSKSKGFTMIELVLVVAVIGIMAGSAIVIINPQKYFNLGKDSQRKNDLKQLQNALTSYYADAAAYPGFNAGPWGQYYASDIKGLAPTYIQSIPTDPDNGPTTCPMYYYSVPITLDKYDIYAKLDPSDANAQKIKSPPTIA